MHLDRPNISSGTESSIKLFDRINVEFVSGYFIMIISPIAPPTTMRFYETAK